MLGTTYKQIAKIIIIIMTANNSFIICYVIIQNMKNNEYIQQCFVETVRKFTYMTTKTNNLNDLGIKQQA